MVVTYEIVYGAGRGLYVAKLTSTLTHIAVCIVLIQYSSVCIGAHANEATVGEIRTRDTMTLVVDRNATLTDSATEAE